MGGSFKLVRRDIVRVYAWERLSGGEGDTKEPHWQLNEEQTKHTLSHSVLAAECSKSFGMSAVPCLECGNERRPFLDLITFGSNFGLFELYI